MKKLTYLIIFICNLGFSQPEVIIIGEARESNPIAKKTLLDAIHTLKNKGTIQIASHIILKDNITVPEGIVIQFIKGSKIILKDNAKLKIEGVIQAGPIQIFDVSEVNSNEEFNIYFTRMKRFFPEWWGILPNVKGGWDYYNNNRQMMLDIKKSNGGHIHFSSGTYFIRDIIIDFSNVTISGEGSSTLLKYDETLNNKGTTTRQGQILGIRGPISNKNLTGNIKWNYTEQIENIVVRDFSIEYNHNGLGAFDHLMNGLVVMNANNVLVENVNVDLNGANRAYYIGAMNNKEKTENIFLRNCKSINSLTGVFISHGYPESGLTKLGKILSNVIVENCNFSVLRSEYDKSSSGYSSGIYLHGSSKTVEPFCKIGKIVLNNNNIENADFGIRLGVNLKADNQNNHLLFIENNVFSNFKICGIFGSFKSGYIKQNIFDSKTLEDVNNSLFENAAIHIRKSTKSYNGVNFLVIENNHFKNVSRIANHNVKHTIYIMPANSGMINIIGNYFEYENDQLPITDIQCFIDWEQYQNKFGILNYDQNKFSFRKYLGYVYIEGDNADDFTVNDLGHNYHYGN